MCDVFFQIVIYFYANLKYGINDNEKAIFSLNFVSGDISVSETEELCKSLHYDDLKYKASALLN